MLWRFSEFWGSSEFLDQKMCSWSWLQHAYRDAFATASGFYTFWGIKGLLIETLIGFRICNDFHGNGLWRVFILVSIRNNTRIWEQSFFSLCEVIPWTEIMWCLDWMIERINQCSINLLWILFPYIHCSNVPACKEVISYDAYSLFTVLSNGELYTTW